MCCYACGSCGKADNDFLWHWDPTFLDEKPFCLDCGICLLEQMYYDEGNIETALMVRSI